MTHLLTFAGLLLCQHRETGALFHRPIDAIGDDAEPVQIDIPIDRLRQSHDQFVRNASPDIASDVTLGAMGTLRIVRAPDRRCISFTRDGLFFSVNDGMVKKSVPGEWEWFLPVTEHEVDVLREILGNAWVIRSSGALIAKGDVRMDVWFLLRFGDLGIDLRYQLPFDLSSWPFRLIVLRDGWRLESVCLFRPLIYFASFRSPVILQQLYESVRSLIELGRYTGSILVLTDQPAHDLARNLPLLGPNKLVVHHTEPTDSVGYVTARYCIADIPWATQFQPVMYMDADILFDADVTPMLTAVARSDRMAAPIEPFAPLRVASSVGSTLLQMDGCSPRYAVGFNCGTLGIPNLPTHGATLRLIQKILHNHAELHGRGALGWVDQEITNYVSFRLADFDTHLISRHVRFGGWPNTEPDLEGRGGAVHFWPAQGQEPALEAMRRYRQRLDALQRTTGGRAPGA